MTLTTPSAPLTRELLQQTRDREAVARAFAGVRAATRALAAPLSEADCAIQSMPDVSPTRWHLAHTTWFFETFVLKAYAPAWTPIDPAYEVLFNSYYNAIGAQYPRDRRGLLTRPSLAEILDYRAQIDGAMSALINICDDSAWARIAPLVQIGLHHEQQHQELIVTDIKHVLAQNPLFPPYHGPPPPSPAPPACIQLACSGGLIEIGHRGDGFAFDNEYPRHKQWLEDYRIASRCVTNGEYLGFVKAGGYRDPRWWLSLGWDTVRAQGWQAPLYWLEQEDAWWQYTLHGLVPIDRHAPVCHLSYFEAEAFARFSEARLPTEQEWEHALAQHGSGDGTFADSGRLHPAPATDGPGLCQMLGDVWEWAASPYMPYPGFRIPSGAVGEYNGKFMCQQYVLRGASCATPSSHVRPTYRNFFPPEARWQFSGLRLAWSGA